MLVIKEPTTLSRRRTPSDCVVYCFRPGDDGMKLGGVGLMNGAADPTSSG